MTTDYRFHIRGHLDDLWSEWLGDLSIERRSDGTSVLSGSVADQAALHGVIARIRDIGLPLLAVEREEAVGSIQPEARGSPAPGDDAREDSNLVDGTLDRPNHNEGDLPCD